MRRPHLILLVNFLQQPFPERAQGKYCRPDVDQEENVINGVSVFLLASIDS